MSTLSLPLSNRSLPPSPAQSQASLALPDSSTPRLRLSSTILPSSASLSLSSESWGGLFAPASPVEHQLSKRTADEEAAEAERVRLLEAKVEKRKSLATRMTDELRELEDRIAKAEERERTLRESKAADPKAT